MSILFSERVKELRKEAGLKQSDLASALGTTQRKVSYWKIGKIEPDLQTLCKIADYFKVSTDYLVGRCDF